MSINSAVAATTAASDAAHSRGLQTCSDDGSFTIPSIIAELEDQHREKPSLFDELAVLSTRSPLMGRMPRLPGERAEALLGVRHRLVA